MGVEIERKFLVRSDAWRAQADAGKAFVQGYIASAPNASVRVRISNDEEAFVTVKGRGVVTRAEYEFSIPVADARDLMEICGDHKLEKRRHKLKQGDNTWEIDVFSGRHAGLVVAEIELTHEEQDFLRPDWLGEEVTADPTYRNEELARPA